MRRCTRIMSITFLLGLATGPAFAGGAPADDPAAVADDAATVAETGGAPAEAVYQAGIRPFHDYWPKTMKVPPGTTVLWQNTDVAEHNVHLLTGEKNALKEDVKGKLFFPGENFAITFNKEGEYRYFCDPHPYMQAHVMVEKGARIEPPTAKPEGDGGSPPAPSSRRDLRGTGGPTGGAAAAANFAVQRFEAAETSDEGADAAQD